MKKTYTDYDSPIEGWGDGGKKAKMRKKMLKKRQELEDHKNDCYGDSDDCPLRKYELQKHK